MSSDHRLLDAATGVFAGMAVIGFWQGIALALTIFAALISIMCGLVRLHDRFKYGRGG